MNIKHIVAFTFLLATTGLSTQPLSAAKTAEQWAQEVPSIKDLPTFNSEVLNSTKTAIVMFHGIAWCSACQATMPDYGKFYTQDKAKYTIRHLDVDEPFYKSLMQKRGGRIKFGLKRKINGVPTFIAYKEGKEVARRTGGLSLGQIKKFARDNS